MAIDEGEQPGLYRRYAEGSIFEIYVLRCEACGRLIDTEQTFYLHVQAAPPFIVSMHRRCASHVIQLR